MSCSKSGRPVGQLAPLLKQHEHRLPRAPTASHRSLYKEESTEAGRNRSNSKEQPIRRLLSLFLLEDKVSKLT